MRGWRGWRRQLSAMTMAETLMEPWLLIEIRAKYALLSMLKTDDADADNLQLDLQVINKPRGISVQLAPTREAQLGKAWRDLRPEPHYSPQRISRRRHSPRVPLFIDFIDFWAALTPRSVFLLIDTACERFHRLNVPSTTVAKPPIWPPQMFATC